MAPPAFRPGHGLLRCPICRRGLTAAAGALVCAGRHSFDIAREGYVNLLRGRRRIAHAGDTADQLRQRAAFLSAGHFDDVAATIARRLEPIAASAADACWRVLDAGCGTGDHLARLAAQLEAPVVGLGLDIAREAARLSARRWSQLAFAVADLRADWPVRDAAIDLVVSSFAPKNFAEMSRVLRPRGWIALVYPGPDHLAELNRRFGLMRHQPHKAREYVDAAARWIGPPTVTRILRRMVLDRTAIRAAVLMGPNARHIDLSALDADMDPLAVTFDLTVLLARKRDRAGARQSPVKIASGKSADTT